MDHLSKLEWEHPKKAGRITYQMVEEAAKPQIQVKPKNVLTITDSQGVKTEVKPHELIEGVLASCKSQTSFQSLRNPHLRYMEKYYTEIYGVKQEHYILVTEAPPGMRRIRHSPMFSTPPGTGEEYCDDDYADVSNVSLPYLINVFPITVNHRSDGVRVLNLELNYVMAFYRTTPLSDIAEDALSVCNLPNVRIDPQNDSGANDAIGWVCYLNEEHAKTVGKNQSIEEALEVFSTELMGYMLSSKFSTSAGSFTAYTATAKKIAEVESIKEWEKNSRGNPLFGLTVEWLPHPKGLTVAQVIKSVKNGMSGTLVNPKDFSARLEKMPKSVLNKILCGKNKQAVM